MPANALTLDDVRRAVCECAVVRSAPTLAFLREEALPGVKVLHSAARVFCEHLGRNVPSGILASFALGYTQSFDLTRSMLGPEERGMHAAMMYGAACVIAARKGAPATESAVEMVRLVAEGRATNRHDGEAERQRVYARAVELFRYVPDEVMP